MHASYGSKFRLRCLSALVVFSIACSSSETSEVLTAPQAARRIVAPGTIFDAAFGVMPTNANGGAFGPVDGGIVIPARSKYVVSVTGSISVGFKENLPCQPLSNGAIGIYGPRTYDRELGIGVTRSFGSDLVFGYLGGDTTALYSDTLWAPVETSLSFSRAGLAGGISCPDGSSSELYALSGSQMVRAKIIENFPPNELVLEPSVVPRVAAGDTLVFQAHEKFSVPGDYFEVEDWTFRPDSSEIEPAPTESHFMCGRSCSYIASRSGTLKVRGRMVPYGPVTDSASVHLDVSVCPWKDPIIDDPQVRRDLRMYLAGSVASKLEQGGVILRSDSTNEYWLAPSGGAPAPTQCSFTVQIVKQAGYTLVGIWHTHPLLRGQFSNCPKAPPGSTAARGPSKPWDYDAQRTAGVPEYIIDPEDVYRVSTVKNVGKWSLFKSDQDVRMEHWKSCKGW